MILFTLGAATLASAQPAYTAHEWGTFTSVQGADGRLVYWRPFQNSELPGFVYDWTKPGMNRVTTSFFPIKGSLATLQRMETPVIYFYSDQKLSVDVSVSFPLGSITEWYPQATRIGPSGPRDTNGPATATLPESRATWKGLSIAPSGIGHGWFDASLPQDKAGSHYFTARETDADIVSTSPGDGTESEKFIFYRGAGSFTTPLQVTTDTAGKLTVANTGTRALPHIFVLNIRGGVANYFDLGGLDPGALSVVALDSHRDFLSLDRFSESLGEQVKRSLVHEGLFEREAAAMVNTWKDSWFKENGVRVLYILPREWTDQTLPLTLDPKPAALVRTMVGRAEVITPSAEKDLADILQKAQGGDPTAHREAVTEFKKLGRFAEPALNLVIHHGLTNIANPGYLLLIEASSSKN